MNQELNNDPKQTREEIDLIVLFNYIKNGIKSVFRKLWELVELFISFIILLKKNWLIFLGITAIGIAFGFYKKYTGVDTSVKRYQMIVKSNPVTNLELYAFASEVNKQNSTESNPQSEGVKFAKSLGFKNMSIEPIPKTEDVINNYFEQIELNTFRGLETDTLYYQGLDITKHKSKMENTDYSLQKINIAVEDSQTQPYQLQEKFLNYINNIPSVKDEQEKRLAILKNYEVQLQKNIANIDSLMIGRVIANKKGGQTGSDQVLVNTASRGNVEWDLLRFAESFSKKLYGTQKMINNYQKGVNVISNMRSISEGGTLDNPIVKYGLIGLLLGMLSVLLLQFNKYLTDFENRKK